MARQEIKKDRICIVCGKVFKGIASANTCTPACRAILVRLKKDGKRPEFILMAKGKGQKIPDLNAPKRLKFKKGEKRPKPEVLEKEIKFAPTTEKSFDGEKVDVVVLDEIGQVEVPKELTPDQKWALKRELEDRLKKVQDRKHQPGGIHPKIFAMNKEAEINEIQEQINKLK